MTTAAATRILTSDQRGQHVLSVVVAATPEAESAAVAFLRRTTGYTVGQQSYRVIFDVPEADAAGATLMDFLSPTCEHGLSLSLCAGPGHYPADL